MSGYLSLKSAFRSQTGVRASRVTLTSAHRGTIVRPRRVSKSMQVLRSDRNLLHRGIQDASDTVPSNDKPPTEEILPLMLSCWASKKTKEKVAIKKLYRPFQSLIHAKRAYRELRLLRHIQHDNVICLLDVFTPDDTLDKFQTFYMVMPLVAQDLGHIMKKRRLTDRIITYLFYQLLRGLKDLKPGNLAVDENCELKVGIDQLTKILRMTGTPDSSLVQKMQSKDAQSYVMGLRPQKKKNFKDVFTSMDEKTVGIMEGMLLLDPETRLTVKQGLSHPYLAEYHDPESEPDSGPYDDSFESLELAVGEWKSLIHMEIMTFDPDNPTTATTSNAAAIAATASDAATISSTAAAAAAAATTW
ncbi:Mitogen-activated protein kinase 12 [Liparis tanakae]|uniref:mitogen-activated protein kinase n=1 Tax=Liparis tanakae TaxID=230148 RepID=A0A4Z2G0V1_9TELE|nr:Mitogen-activated protein kinase 12 [Liparis tanakae]